MKFNKWTLIILIILIAIIYVSIPKNQMSGPKTNEDSLANVESRKLKDETFRDSDESPIKDKKMFKGLAYYAFNQKWIISFEVQRSEKIEKIKINMTDGSQEDMLKFGTITAKINGAEVKLELFTMEGKCVWTVVRSLQNEVIVPVQAYPSGMYQLRISASKGSQRFSFVKE